MLNTGSSSAALLMSASIWSTVGGSGRLARTILFLLLEPICFGSVRFGPVRSRLCASVFFSSRVLILAGSGAGRQNSGPALEHDVSRFLQTRDVRRGSDTSGREKDPTTTTAGSAYTATGHDVKQPEIQCCIFFFFLKHFL